MSTRCMRAVLLAVGLLGVSAAPVSGQDAPKPASKDTAEATFQDKFDVDKDALLDSGSNRYMVLQPGYKLVLADGKDTLTITVLDDTKVVDGVKTRVVEERETEGGKLAEVSRNYFAFDKATRDIYYFGEEVDAYDAAGNVKGHEGSWLSGTNGATFGLIMPGKPKVGGRYYQELAPKAAMDRAEVVSIAEKVKVPAGTYEDCLKTRESSGLEKGSEEKLYAPGIGLLKDGGFRLATIEKPPVKLPDPVARTFAAAFPKGEILKMDAEEENGVMVYDLEFTDGTTEKETDITADGIMLEFTVVIPAKKVPGAAMKSVRKAARGAKIGRIEQVEISYELKDGKVVKLDKAVTHYEVEIVKNDKTSEIVVNPDGTAVVEPGEKPAP
jgi:uncharacterized membrane protein YkoI